MAVRWNCTRCKVSVGRLDGGGSDLPNTWTLVEGATYCLSCSRARAGEAAMDSLPETTSPEDRFRCRRDALIAFEIHRVPEAPNRVIAGACRTSPRTVAAIRDELNLPLPALESTAPHAV